MKKMLKYLSPFAPDQSGACGVLYELGGIIVICDAGGCSGNICGFDEPRWFTKKSAVFSAGLRDMDAIMGRDDRLIEKLSKAYDQIGGEFAAIIATPVPAVIGTDMKALKRMAEKKLGIPAITINAIGTRYYDEGEQEAWLNLFKEFAGKMGTEKTENRPLSFTGILGATPLETGFATAEPLLEMAKKEGIDNPIIYGLGSGLDAIKNIQNIEKNLVVSVAGLRTAEYLKEEYGIPYDIGFPFIPESVINEVNDSIDLLLSKKLSSNADSLLDEIHSSNKESILHKESTSTEKSLGVLIIHTQLASNELRTKIRQKLTDSASGNILDSTNINCATFFMQNSEYAMEPGDIKLTGEDDLSDLVANNYYDLIIADADLKRLLDVSGYTGHFVDFPHFAVSGRMNDDSIMFFNT